MQSRSLRLIILVLLGACGGVGSGSNGISTAGDAGVSTACIDDFDPNCWTGPWGEFEPPPTYPPDPRVPDDAGEVIHDGGGGGSDATIADGGGSDASIGDGGTPDAGCAGQPEPACPQPPGGYLAQNPGIPGGGQCRGACGPACPPTCRAGTPTSSCVEWQTADCHWHAKTCTYPVLECGTHMGCRDHDTCYDGCALLRWGIQRAACRRECDATCIRRNGITKCNSWRKGGGPYDPTWLQFTGTPTTSTSETTCF